LSAAIVALPAPASAGVGGSPADPQGARIAALKASLDPEAAPTVSKEEQNRVAAKNAASLKYLADKTAGRAGGEVGTMGVLYLPWQKQETGFWCGPAVVSMITNARGRGMGQDEAARNLGTTVDGTPWWSSFRSPMQKVLNERLQTGWYEAKALDDWPTAAQKQLFRADVVFNTDRGYHIAGNAYEALPNYRLNGHPTDRTIFHWIAIGGYSGEAAWYADPAAETGGGFENVPRTSWLHMDTLSIIMGGRGYVA
jgi:hypothetical protein